MRVAAVFLALTSTMNVRVCSSEDEAPPPPPVSAAGTIEAEVVVDVPEPVHGGTVVAADDYYVELLAVPSGEVHAWVLEVEGHPPPPPEAELTVYMNAHDGRRHPVVLSWDADVTVYRGHLVDVEPAPGPFMVEVVVDGHVHRGHHEHYVVLSPPRAELHLETWGPRAHVRHVARGPRGHVEVRGPRPRGRVDVRVEAPPPPHVQVELNVPRPPSFGVRVDGHAHVEGHGHVERRHRGRGRGDHDD